MKTKIIQSILMVTLLSVMMVGTVAAEPTVIFDGSVGLSDGTFTFIPSNNLTASYEIETMTDHGALDAASNVGSGFTYNASDAYYFDPYYGGSFFLLDINGIENDYEASTSWFIYVNDEIAPLGLSQNIIEVGDQVTFLYAPYAYNEYWEVIVDETNATYIVDVEVRSADAISNIEDLQDYIDALDAPHCTKVILDARLNGVIFSLEHDRDCMAIMKLRMFSRAVERQEFLGNLTSAEADCLTDEADYIIGLIED